MDLLAQYIMVDNSVIAELMEMDSDDLIKNVVELNDAAADEALSIGKMWDGLHFLLTGVSAQEAYEHTHLSQALIGAHMFNADDVERYFVGYTTNQDLPAIIEAMQYVDLTALSKKFKPEKFRENRIYPDIWQDNYQVALFCELSEAFENLLAFTERAHTAGKNIICSVY